MRTPKQVEQTAILAGTAMHSMSMGGSRSGKTFGKCRALVIRAMKCKSRHLALRLKFNHAKTSLWYETFPKVFDICFPGLRVKPNKSDWFYRLPNGSEIWIGGLDEKERVEKILGKEYSTLYFNECSQIPYTSITMALTRLAEKNILKKRAWYDENPPTKRHWSYPLFILKKDPNLWTPLPNPDNYNSILMNPTDNIDNIDDEYISNILDALPEREKKRFKYGEFNDDASGNIYYAFDREKHVGKFERIQHIPLVIGMDFNVNPFTYVIGQVYVDKGRQKLRIIAEGWLKNSNTREACRKIQSDFPGRWTVVPDSTGKSRHTSQAESGATDHQIIEDYGFEVPYVRNPYRVDRYNEVNALAENCDLEIDESCTNLIADLEQVVYDDGTNMPNTKDKNRTHISDALGYLVHYFFPLVKVDSRVETNIDR